MKIAVTYNNGQIFQHFGHTETFKVHQVEDGKVASSAILDSSGSGHGALASLLRSQGVDALICGGIGGGAKTALAQAGVTLYGGVSGLSLIHIWYATAWSSPPARCGTTTRRS